MKAIKTNANITSISSRADNSLRLSVVTPELTPAEQVEFLRLKNTNIDLYIKPNDYEIEDIQEIKTEIDEKTPSQRLRNVMFVLWKKLGGQGDFKAYYEQTMNKLIEKYKDKIDEYD